MAKLTDQQMAEEALAADVFRTDELAWYEGFGSIVLKSGEEQAPPLANFLQLLISAVKSEFRRRGLPVRILTLKPRQKGSTTYSSANLYHDVRRKRTSACVIGAQYSQTTNALEIVKHYQAKDVFPWGNEGTVTEEVGRWSNGSKLVMETAGDGEAGRSGTYQFLLGTEVARWAEKGVKDARKVLAGILKCVPTLADTCVILETTASGACYDKETQVLTDKGWVFFKDLTRDEAILTKNPDTGATYYQPDWKPMAYHWSGDMVRFSATGVNLLVTPNHQMWMARQKGPMKFIQAADALGKKTDYLFERTMAWDARGFDEFVLPAYTHRQSMGMRTLPERRIPINDWLVFLGHFLSDGNVRWKYGCKHVVLTQVKFIEEFRRSAQAVADAIGCSLIENDHGKGKRFIMANAQLASYLKDFSQPKRIPRELLMGLSRAQFRVLLEAIYEGDGCLHRRAGMISHDGGRVYVGVDHTLEDDLQELCLKAGYATSACGPERNRKVTFSEAPRSMIKFDNPPVLERGFDGMVYCVTLPKDHLLMVRRGGTAVWCGNSGDFYDRWLGAIDAADFLAGAPLQPGAYVRVFAAWFEFHDSAQRLTVKEQLAVQDGLDTEERYRGERELLNEFGWRDADGVMRLGKSCNKPVPGPGGTMIGPFTAWEQLAWRRWSIDDECKRSVEVFNQDYPESWQKAFLMSGRRRFNAAGLRLTRAGVRAPEFGVLEQQAEGTRAVWRSISEEEAMIYRYEAPRAGRRYLLCADTMTGASQTSGADPDCHGVFVLRQGYFESGRGWVPPAVAARIRPPCRWDIDILEEQVWRLAQYYGGRMGCMIAPEINMDRGMVELLKRRGAIIYERQVFNEREGRVTGQLGWQTTKATREPILENLAKAIREQGQEGQGFDVRDSHALSEMEHFVVKETGRSEAESGHHDDDVLSLAIGLLLIGSATELGEEVVQRKLPRDLELMERARRALRVSGRGYG